ncbi:ABC transporter ATP-binding protein [Pedobacter sp.]|uniref:ABC transporter ATP-binding protein n=1 Tax=Pedobacter sp. TaxID=1411316 RepID=UPI003BABE031
MIEISIFKKIKTHHGTLELNVDAVFQSHSITRILGPSGVGKTTFLKMLAGLITPDAGKIIVKNELWFDEANAYSKPVQNRAVGFVFQDYALFPNMTVEKQLKYGSDDPEYIDRLLEIGELSRYRKSLPRQLSGGQQQRLAILRALSTKPGLLLMDEPFSALDLELKNRLINNLKTLLAEQKTTVILVTHAETEMSEEGNNSFILTEKGMISG